MVSDSISCLEYTPSKCISSHFNFIKLLTTKYDPDIKHHVKWKAFFCFYNSCDNSTVTIDVGKNIEEQTAGVMIFLLAVERREKMKSNLL